MKHFVKSSNQPPGVWLVVVAGAVSSRRSTAPSRCDPPRGEGDARRRRACTARRPRASRRPRPEHVLVPRGSDPSIADASAELAAPNLDGAAALGTTDATRVLALDGIQDPGNLGTLVRTALALGWDAVALLPGTCDPFNDKARSLRFPVSRSPRTRARPARFSRLLPMMSSPKSHEHCHAARLGSRPVAPRSSSSFRVLDESQPPRPSLSAPALATPNAPAEEGHLSPAPTTSSGPKHHFTTWFRPTITSRRGFARPSRPRDSEPVPSSFVSVLVAQALARARAECSDFPWASHVVRARGGDGRTSSASILRRAHRGGRGGRHGDARMGRRRRRRRRRRVVSRARIRGTGSVRRRARICRPVAIPRPG